METETLRGLLEDAEGFRVEHDDVHEADVIYAPLYAALQIPRSLLDLIEAADLISVQDSWIPFLFPPCGIPLWGSSHLFIYEWRHWFVDGRAPVLVESDPELGTVFELARTYEQLGYFIAQNELVISDEETDDFQVACRAFDIGDKEDVVSRWEASGDLRSAFASHRSFEGNLPQSCVPAKSLYYKGDFPLHTLELVGDLSKTTSFELCGSSGHAQVQRQLRDLVRSRSSSPPWLRSTDQAAVFDRLIREHDLAGAWLSLCSSGWTYGDAKDALARLAEHTDDYRFKIQATCWSSLPFYDSQRY
ncbi:MAG: hypothetical protein AAGM22_19280 [Acidobacteriota bacterium]